MKKLTPVVLAGMHGLVSGVATTLDEAKQAVSR
jgi:hypothetical protein